MKYINQFSPSFPYLSKKVQQRWEYNETWESAESTFDGQINKSICQQMIFKHDKNKIDIQFCNVWHFRIRITKLYIFCNEKKSVGLFFIGIAFFILKFFKRKVHLYIWGSGLIFWKEENDYIWTSEPQMMILFVLQLLTLKKKTFIFLDYFLN